MKAGALVIVVLCSFIALSREQVSDRTLQHLRDAVTAASRPLELSVNDGCLNTYHAGQEMKITVRSPLGGYLYLFYFRADGEVTMMLFPCRHFWGDFPVTVRSDSPLTLPPNGARIGLAFGHPFGREALVGVVVPIEQTDLVAYFRAYEVREFGYRTGDQEGFALFLARRVADLQRRGIPCAASVCVFFSEPRPADRAPSSAGACVVGSAFRCGSGGLPTGCLPEGTDIPDVLRSALPNTFGPGDDAVLLDPGHYQGELGEGDWHDWYRVRSPHGAGYVLWFDPGGLVVDLYLLHDPCGDVLAECLSVTEPRVILIPCYAGVECPGLEACFGEGECRFFLRIVWRGGRGAYRLSLLPGQPEIPARAAP